MNDNSENATLSAGTEPSAETVMIDGEEMTADEAELRCLREFEDYESAKRTAWKNAAMNRLAHLAKTHARRRAAEKAAKKARRRNRHRR